MRVLSGSARFRRDDMLDNSGKTDPLQISQGDFDPARELLVIMVDVVVLGGWLGSKRLPRLQYGREGWDLR